MEKIRFDSLSLSLSGSLSLCLSVSLSLSLSLSLSTSVGAYSIIALATCNRKCGLSSWKYLTLRGVPCIKIQLRHCISLLSACTYLDRWKVDLDGLLKESYHLKGWLLLLLCHQGIQIDKIRLLSNGRLNLKLLIRKHTTKSVAIYLL